MNGMSGVRRIIPNRLSNQFTRPFDLITPFVAGAGVFLFCLIAVMIEGGILVFDVFHGPTAKEAERSQALQSACSAAFPEQPQNLPARYIQSKHKVHLEDHEYICGSEKKSNKFVSRIYKVIKFVYGCGFDKSTASMAGFFRNHLLALNKEGQVCKTIGIKFITSPEVVYLARNAGFHAIFIDLEHSSLSLKTANCLCVAALNADVSPFVRVPGRVEAGFVQRVLDNGAQGVVFPHVDIPEQAQTAVRASKYPPLGKRSVTGMLPQMSYQSTTIAQVSKVGNSELSTVFVMIESPEAVENVDAIAGVEGVDVVLIGTNDLSIELGCPGDFDNPTFLESVQKIAAAVKKYGKILGVAGIYNRPDILHRLIHEFGARFIVGHVDLPMLAKAANETATELQRLEEVQNYIT